MKAHLSPLTMKYLLLRKISISSLLLVFFTSSIYCQPYYIQVSDTSDLTKFFKWTPDRIPLISAHRGGPAPGYPENCLETFDNMLNHAYVLIECDVQLTKDGHLVMMHDETLDRTTNGRGKVAEKTLLELKNLVLKDNLGNITPYKIPTLGEVLAWGKNKTIVQLDIKKGVPAEKVVQEIKRNHAYAYSLVITYNPEDAEQYHRLNKNILISATVRNNKELARLEKTNIPADKLVAFVGITEPDPSLYQMLHSKGIYCVLGTLGNLDRKAEARQSNIYAKLLQNGADIIATDRPLAVNEVIKEITPPKSEKTRFFKAASE